MPAFDQFGLHMILETCFCFIESVIDWFNLCMTCYTWFCFIQTVLSWFKLYSIHSTCIWCSCLTQPISLFNSTCIWLIQFVISQFQWYTLDLTWILSLWLELDWFNMYFVGSTCACPIQHAFDPFIQCPTSSACIILILLYFIIYILPEYEWFNLYLINSTHIWYCGPFFVWFNLYFIYAAWILSVWHILDLKQPVFDPFYMYSIDTDCLSSFLPVHDLLCTYLIIFYWFNLCVTFSTSLQSIHPAFGQCSMCLAKSTQI